MELLLYIIFFFLVVGGVSVKAWFSTVHSWHFLNPPHLARHWFPAIQKQLLSWSTQLLIWTRAASKLFRSWLIPSDFCNLLALVQWTLPCYKCQYIYIEREILALGFVILFYAWPIWNKLALRLDFFRTPRFLQSKPLNSLNTII